MSDEREQIVRELARVGLGELDGLSGRVLQARVAALRRAELVTREEEDEPRERWEPPDYPVGPDGRFDPSCAPGL